MLAGSAVRLSPQSVAIFSMLEPRRVFDGAVEASRAADGTLEIHTSDDATALYIERLNDGSVASLSVRGLSGTQVNGAASGDFENVRSISIRSSGTDASVTFANIRLERRLEVSLAGGVNRVVIRSARVGGDVSLVGGAGEDRFEFRDAAIAGDLTATGGFGDDRLRLNRTRVGSGLEWSDRSGRSRISVVHSRIAAASLVHSGNSIDRFEVESSAFSGTASLRQFAGNDSLVIRNTTFGTAPLVDAGAGTDNVIRELRFDFDFAESHQGWRAGFSDYAVANPDGDDPFDAYEMSSGIAPLPSELGLNANGFRLSGANRSDDLFMFLTRALTAGDGIDPRSRYRISFDVEFASSVATGTAGIGGSPADSVYMKVGGVAKSPVVGPNARGNRFELNVNKGNNGVSLPAGDLSIAGNVANGGPLGSYGVYRLARRTHTHPASVSPRADGRIWLVVGTDSGFEGTTVLYYRAVHVRLVPIQSSNG